MKIIKEESISTGKGNYLLIKYYAGEVDWVKAYKTQADAEDALIEYSNMYSYSPEVRFSVRSRDEYED